ncbi:hypothetical protein KQH81_07915 [Clostridium cadaveris]|uniref:hypothetical protein n=1 Tax=Clostridium cadaveris TaxID=1529 RepID=UPI001E2B3AB3|nr:hypothetical protein [Clostridium cadaveris]UFH66436.1 hypothetical protein KQH81_07915 [Clostridium cadaveris]
MEKQKYYVLDNKYMADAISYLLGRRYMIFDDRFNERKKVYSFVDDNSFREVLKITYDTRRKYNDYFNKEN